MRARRKQRGTGILPVANRGGTPQPREFSGHALRRGIVDELKEKYKHRLARAEEELRADRKRWRGCRCNYISDLLLFEKWAYRVGKGWYGFNLGHVPPVWLDMINDFLSWLELECPDFEIHQVKIKVGGLRLYVGTKTKLMIPDERVRAEISALERLLKTPQYLRSVRLAEHARLAAQKKPRKTGPK
jgi:hypothetical protein